MVGAGIASAVLFAPALCYAATLPDSRKETAMAMLNTAGCAGMLLGPVSAGLTSAFAGRTDPVTGYRAVFAMAAGALCLWLVASTPWLLRQFRRESSAQPDTTAAG